MIKFNKLMIGDKIKTASEKIIIEIKIIK